MKYLLIKIGILVLVCSALCGCHAIRVAGEHGDVSFSEEPNVRFKMQSFLDCRGVPLRNPNDSEGLILEYMTPIDRSELESELCQLYPSLFGADPEAYPIHIELGAMVKRNPLNVFSVVSLASGLFIPINVEMHDQIVVTVSSSISDSQIGVEKGTVQWRQAISLFPITRLLIWKNASSKYRGESARVFGKWLGAFPSESRAKVRKVRSIECAHMVAEVLKNSNMESLQRDRLLKNMEKKAYE